MIGSVNTPNVPMGCRCGGSTVQDASATKAANLSLEAHKTSDISFVTKEGDIVTLFAKEDLSATYSSYRNVSAGEDGSSAISVRNSSVNQTQEFSFSVQGDLSKEEMKDIQKALRTIDKILESFVDGKIDTVMKKMGNLTQLDSLARIEADIQLERSLTVEQQSLTEITYVPTYGAEYPYLPADPGDTLMQPDEYKAEAGLITDEAQQEIDEAATAMADAVSETGADPVAVAKPADDAFEKHIKNMPGRKGRQSERIEEMRKLRNRFFEKLRDLIAHWETKDPQKSRRIGGDLFQKAA